MMLRDFFDFMAVVGLAGWCGRWRMNSSYAAISNLEGIQQID
jgi:hypothetical protein